jgi:uncharacterized protein
MTLPETRPSFDAPISLRHALVVGAPLAIALLVVVVTKRPGFGLVGMITSTVLALRAGGSWRASLQLLGLGGRPVGHAVLLGVGGAMVVALLLSVVVLPPVARAFGAPDLSAFAILEGNPVALAVALLVAWTSAAFGEEIVFRGVIQRALELRVGAVVAVVVTAVFFGLSHFYQGATGCIGSGAAGLVFGALATRRQYGLWPAVIAHGLYDTFGLVSIFLRGV